MCFRPVEAFEPYNLQLLTSFEGELEHEKIRSSPIELSLENPKAMY